VSAETAELLTPIVRAALQQFGNCRVSKGALLRAVPNRLGGHASL
jgi:hypothetical protein